MALIYHATLEDLLPTVGDSNLVAGSGAAVDGDHLSLPNYSSGVYPETPIALGSTYTISLWFNGLKNRASATSEFMMMDGYSNAGTNGNAAGSSVGNYTMAVYSGDFLGAWDTAFRSSGYAMTQANFPPDEWHHIVASFNNGTLTYYIDGAQVGNSVSYTGSPNIQIFGSWLDYSYGFADYFDDIQVYDNALSAGDVSTLFAGGRMQLTDGIVATWNFDDDTGDDSVGSANGTVTDLTYATADGITYAEADGSGNKMDLGTPAALDLGTSDFTISGWANMDAIPTGASGAILYNKGMTSQSSPQFNGTQISFYQGNVRFFIGGQGSYTTISEPMSTGQWYHFMGTRSGTTMKFYVNGVLVDTKDTGTVKDVTSPLNGTIFSNYNGTWYTNAFDGKLADIRIWSRALSDGEAASVHTTGPETSALSLTDGLVAKYALDTNATESVSSNDLSTSGTVSYGVDGSHTAAEFASGELESADVIDLTGQATVSFWAKEGTPYSYSGNTYSSFFRWGTTTGSYFDLYLLNGKIRSLHNNAASGWDDNRGTVSVPAGWNHYAMTIDPASGEKIIYLNGVAQALTGPAFTGTFAAPQKIFLGNISNGNAAFRLNGGKMDDTRIWTRVLSASEIAELHTTGPETGALSLTDSLVFKAALSEDDNDSIQGIDGTSSNVSFIQDEGHYAMDFTAANAIVQFGNDAAQGGAVLGTSDFTISAWVKPTGTQSPGAVILGQTISSSSSPKYNGVQLRLNGTNLECVIGSQNLFESPVSSAISFDAWHHVMATREGTSIKLYIDGVLVDSGTTSQVMDTSSSFAGHILSMGGTSNGSAGFYGYNGYIDDGRMWKRALSGAEALSVFNTGAETPVLELTDGLVAQYALDADATDSINGIDGTSSGTSFNTASGRSFASFDGDDYITVPHNAATQNFNGDFTFSMWFKSNGSGGGNNTMFSKMYHSATGGHQVGTSVYINENNVGFFLRTKSADYFAFHPAVVTDNQWHLLTVVRDGSEMTTFVDGVADTTITGITGTSDSAQEMQIARWKNSTGNVDQYYTGEIDEIRIYNRTLSSTEVGELYTAGAATPPLADSLVAKYPLDSDGVPSVGDVTFTASNVTYGAGESFSTFASQNSGYYVNSPYLDLADEYTLSFWFMNLKSRAAAPYGFLMAAAYNKETGGVGGYENWDVETNYDIVIYTNDMLGAYGHANASAGASTLNSTGYQMTQALYNGTGWHHMACAFSGGQMTYYINGVQVGVPVSTTGMDKLQTIGSYTDMNYAAFEYMDDFRVYNKAISAAEAVVLHTEGVEAPAAPAAATYELTVFQTDSYGDSWNGGNIAISDANGTAIQTFSGPASGVKAPAGLTETVSVEAGTYTYVVTPGAWPSEIAILITDPDGVTLASLAGDAGTGTFTVTAPAAGITPSTSVSGAAITVSATVNAVATAEGAANWSASLTGFGTVGATIDGAKALTAIGVDAALTAPSSGTHTVYVAVVDGSGVILAKSSINASVFISQLNVGDDIIIMSYLEHPSLVPAGTHDQLTDDDGDLKYGPIYIGDLTIKSLSINSADSDEIVTDVTFEDPNGGDLDLDALVIELIKKYNLNLLSGVQASDGAVFQSVVDGTAGFSASALLSWNAEDTNTTMLPSGGGHYAEYDAVFYGNQISEVPPGVGSTAGPNGNSFVGNIAPGETAPAQASSYDPFHGGNLSNIVQYVHGTDAGPNRSHMHLKNDSGNTVLYFTQDLQTWSAFTSYGPDTHGIYDAPACAAYGPAGKVLIGTEAGCVYLVELDASSVPLSFTKVHDNGNTGKINQVHFGVTSNAWIIEYSEKVNTMPAGGGALTERMTIPTGAVVVDISEANDAICIVVRKSDFTFASYIALTNWTAVHDESQMSAVLTSLGITDFNYAYDIDEWCAASPDGTVVTTDDISNWLL
jgi:hypothetical protein